MGTTLDRTTFSTSRLLEFFTVKELQMQIGHSSAWWPVALVKELIDNGLDACEMAGASPEITVTVEPDAVSVRDNGPGLPIGTLKKSLDYALRVSDKTYYVSPTRGQLGNALKCVWAAPFVVDGTHGRVDIVTGGNEYQVDVTLDRIGQEPRLEVTTSPDGVVKTGTLAKMHWPRIAGYLGFDHGYGFYNRRLSASEMVQRYGAFNPHATLHYVAPDSQHAQEATSPGWRKWTPGDPTSPHWYNVERLQALIAAYVADERRSGKARTVREFVSEFKGLTSSRKQKVVTEAAGLAGAYLHDLVHDDAIDRARVVALLEAMQAEARPVKPAALGVIGEEHLSAWMTGPGLVSGDCVKYAKKVGATADGLPFVVEAAFGVLGPEHSECGRTLAVGLNWAPVLKVPFDNLHHLLSDNYVDSSDPVIVVVHLACPLLEFTDRGKSTLALPQETADGLRLAVGRVTAGWRKMKAQKKREERAQERDLERLRKNRRPEKVSIKDAAYQVMEAAYIMASGNGRYPANARQIMYAARGPVQDLAGKYWEKSSYFTQRLLPDYLEEYAKKTATWDVVFDARGQLVEPHTDNDVALGTLEVRRYVAQWVDVGADVTCLEVEKAYPTMGPVNRYRFVLFVEKGGFNELWRVARIAERYDLAIMSTKGMSVTAARQLVAELSERGVTILVLRDFDKAGFSIVHTLRSDTRRHSFDERPNVIDLGFRLEDIAGLEREWVEYRQKKDPRRNLRKSGATEEECNILVRWRDGRRWEGERVELNAMTSDQLVAWLERKLEAVGAQKVVPDDDVLEKSYRRAVLLDTIQEAIDRAHKEFDGDAVETPDDLRGHVRDKIEGAEKAWDDAIWELAQETAG